MNRNNRLSVQIDKISKINKKYNERLSFIGNDSNENSSISNNVTPRESKPDQNNVICDNDVLNVDEVEENNIDDMKNTINELNEKMITLQEKVDDITQERDQLMSEMRDMSGVLIEEAHKNIKQIHQEKEILEKKLNQCNITVKALQTQNDILKNIMTNNRIKNVLGKFRISRKPSIDDKDDSIIEFKYEFLTNPYYFELFINWYKIECPQDNIFFTNILNEDIYPCLHFANPEVEEASRSFLENWKSIPSIDPSKEKNKICDFLLVPCETCYYIRFGSDKKYVASPKARSLFLSLIDLYNYLYYISSKLIKTTPEQMFYSICKYRLLISLHRYGYYPLDNR